MKMGFGLIDRGGVGGMVGVGGCESSWRVVGGAWEGGERVMIVTNEKEAKTQHYTFQVAQSKAE